mmetsp:Transcript_60544/g.148546  ORF Transcript_60544/g.148546 Transcript_60544/m.148546 type:complete len:116 (+) Transcript_60544:37-384(+)
MGYHSRGANHLIVLNFTVQTNFLQIHHFCSRCIYYLTRTSTYIYAISPSSTRWPGPCCFFESSCLSSANGTAGCASPSSSPSSSSVSVLQSTVLSTSLIGDDGDKSSSLYTNVPL